MFMMSKDKLGFCPTTLAAVLLSGSLVHAMPSPGDMLPRAHVLDAEDRRFDIASARGKPILVVYEDKDSANLNAGFKLELGRLAKSGQYRDAVALVPVADVRGYDYWPVRGFVKDAIRSESRRQGTTIYCDWSGEFSRALALPRATSNVVLYGKDGRVLFAKAGQLSQRELQSAIQLLRAEVGATR